MLSIAGDPSQFVVNELDDNRYNNLTKEDYKQVLHQDATKPFPFEYGTFDGLLANPPFASTEESLVVEGYKISGLEQQIIIKALRYNKESAKTAFIIGGHTEYDEKGRLRLAKDKSFFSYLYGRYELKDVIHLNGELYGRQGTKYPIRIVLVGPRKPTFSGFYPLADFTLDQFTRFSTKQVNTFAELYKRFQQNLA